MSHIPYTSTKKNIKLRNVTYISPSHSKPSFMPVAKRLIQMNGLNSTKRSDSNQSRNRQKYMTDLYRSSSSNSRSKLYSKITFYKKHNNGDMITTSSTASHNNSMNFSSTNNYHYNYIPFSKKRQLNSSSSSTRNINLSKSQSSSNYIGLGNKIRDNCLSKESKRSNKLIRRTDLSASSEMKTFYNDISYKNISHINTNNHIQHNLLRSDSLGKFNNFVEKKEYTQIDINKETISTTESPEELHFFYVNILQKGKNVQKKFDI